MSMRKITKSLQKIGLVRSLGIWLADRRAQKWLSHHPGRNFADYYAAHVARRLREGKPHPSLGKVAYSYEGGWKRALDESNFSAFGRDHWRPYAARVTDPSWRCVDYGCGSLRLGQFAIREQDAGCYWGIDVTDRFIAEGKALVGDSLMASKKPRFGPIDEKTVRAIADWKPDFVFSNAVLQHVPPAELSTYFDRLATMMGDGCEAMIIYIAAPALERIKAMSWAYSEAVLARAARAADPNWQIEFSTVPMDADGGEHRKRDVLFLRRPVATAARIAVGDLVAAY